MSEMESAVKEEQEQKQEQPQDTQDVNTSSAYFSFPSLSFQSEWWLKFALGATGTLLGVGAVMWLRRKR